MQKESPTSSPPQPRFAKVALPVPLNKAFTYEIPEVMAGDVFVGRRVEVPFGNRVLSGVVVDLSHQSDVPKTKPIKSLFDTYLPAHLLKITEWIASYYGCSQGESAQSVLPPSLKKARTRPQRGGVVALADRSVLDRNGGDGREETGSLNATEERLSGAKKQLALFRTLVRAGGEVPLKTLTSEWGVTRSVLDGLVKKGIVTIKPRSRSSPLEAMEEAVEVLTPSQQTALKKAKEAVRSRTFTPALLYGVTGSGKTEIYLRAARLVLAEGGGCIVLVPEIGLLPQATARYRKMFGNEVAVIHSRLTGPERYDIWEKTANGTYRIVVGPRSAVFSPVKNLRLIIVDEEQDDSYKQGEKPRYHARNVALMRGKYEGLAVILGSATPSAETLRQSLEGHYALLRLPDRTHGAPLPDIRLVDMRVDPPKGQFFSKILTEALERNIEAGGQSIIFLNKRGHARFVQCSRCGWVAACKNCDISLTYHRVDNRLKCHFCGFSRPAVTRCDSCESVKLYFSGAGTQRVELDLTTLFPGTGVLRMDADTTAGKEGHRRILEKFSTGRYPILLGTQMVSKGHHFPGVNLVGVLHAEEGLSFPDFRSAERTFQQLTQVAGRCGRGDRPGRVIIQTFIPDHYVFRYLKSHDYDGFMEKELAIRRQLDYPPYKRIVLASCSARDPVILHVLMEEWAEAVRSSLPAGRFSVLGPAPPLVPRVKNSYREQMLIKGNLTRAQKEGVLASYQRIVERHRAASKVDLRWDVDPESFV
jgi:primosomal protein N' (replication factor Y)